MAVALVIEDVFFQGIRTASSIFLLVILIPSLSLSVRRLHDINFSGWWVLLGFLPIIGSIPLIIMSLWPSRNVSDRYGSYPLKKSEYVMVKVER